MAGPIALTDHAGSLAAAGEERQGIAQRVGPRAVRSAGRACLIAWVRSPVEMSGVGGWSCRRMSRRFRSADAGADRKGASILRIPDLTDPDHPTPVRIEEAEVWTALVFQGSGFEGHAGVDDARTAGDPFPIREAGAPIR